MLAKITGLFRPKSKGVRVSRAVYRHIRDGDAARRRGDWLAAADAYRMALDEMPGLQHIWVQYGHAGKEAGDLAAAADAYRQAAALAPDDPEPHMYLGHMAKRLGTGHAARHYLDALRRAPADLGAIGEVMQQLLAGRSEDAAFIDEALDLLGIDRAAVTVGIVTEVAMAGTVFLDVSDVLRYFSVSRIPSGIQRVQIEIVLGLLRRSDDATVALCFHVSARHGWTVVPVPVFLALCEPTHGDTEIWAERLRILYLASALSDTIAFPTDAILVSFGAGAPDTNYLLDVRTEAYRTGLIYIPMIYDLIPILRPDWFTPALAGSFAASLASLLHTAKGYLAISATTRGDLLAHAVTHDCALTDERVRVIALDGSALDQTRKRLASSTLAKWRLKPGGYVLFVSTIEPRKNHIGAFAAWRRLAKDIGVHAMPDLVCVGGKGWLNEDIHAALARDPLLRRKVRLLSGIGDDELDLLYRDCAFTIYPSFYEGWGLPVTESLSYGKVPAISDAASLPEAGGRFAVYYDPHDAASIAVAIRPLIVDPVGRTAREADIAAHFRPRPWLTIGRELLAQARAIAADVRSEGERVPVAPLATTISVATADRIGGAAINGEMFRHGRGWSAPEPDGCRVTGPDAILRFTVPPGGAILRVDARAGDTAAVFAVQATQQAIGSLAPHERRQVRVPLPAMRLVEITIAAREADRLIVESFAIER